MKLRKLTLAVLCLFSLLSSCKKDDDNNGPTFVPADRTEQQVIDGDSLIRYLQTHYYNSSTFATPGDYHVEDIVIKELPKDATGNYLPLPNPNDNTLLFESELLETRDITFLDVSYKYYVLRLNQGGGKSPHFSDILRVKYSGMLENGVVFDSTINPIDLPFVQPNGQGVIEGWKIVMPQFNAASSFNINDDNTVNYTNPGLGVMFLPSGLAYFASPPPGSPISLYSNLIFKFEVLQFQEVDHDDDGIPTYVEDLNSNRNVFDDDTDNDRTPNAFDTDDDNDGVSTLDELKGFTYVIDTNLGENEPTLEVGEYIRSRTVADGIITLKTVKVMDTNGNSIPDYLDSAITINYNE